MTTSCNFSFAPLTTAQAESYSSIQSNSLVSTTTINSHFIRLFHQHSGLLFSYDEFIGSLLPLQARPGCSFIPNAHIPLEPSWGVWTLTGDSIIGQDRWINSHIWWRFWHGFFQPWMGKVIWVYFNKQSEDIHVQHHNTLTMNIVMSAYVWWFLLASWRCGRAIHIVATKKAWWWWWWRWSHHQ